MSELKGTYYYFKDFANINSQDYGKIAIVKAENDKDAWEELTKRHNKQYGETNQPIETMYLFLETRKID